MSTTVEAVYEGGVLRLKEPMPLPDGTTVRVTVAVPPPEDAFPGDASPGKRTPAEIAARIAALYEPRDDGPDFSGRDHDKILYGWDGKDPA